MRRIAWIVGIVSAAAALAAGTVASARQPEPREVPPAASLEIEGIMHPLRLGSYCWDGLCSDTFGIVTDDQALRLSSPITGTLRLAIPDPPENVRLWAVRVAPTEAIRRGEDWIVWPWKIEPARAHVLAPAVEQQVRIDLPAGLYALLLSADWPDRRGDASYGLLVEVDGPVYLPLAEVGSGGAPWVRER